MTFIRFSPFSLQCLWLRLVQLDSSLATRVDKVMVVFFADIFGDRPVAMTLERPAGCVRGRESLGIRDGGFYRHRVRIGKTKPFENFHAVAVRNSRRELCQRRKP